MEQGRNCAFQYTKMYTQIFKPTEIVCDKDKLTLEEAKALWNKYFSDCANHIFQWGTAEMVIWINMEAPGDYGETLQYISVDAESDGSSIWENVRTYFTEEFI